MISIMCNRGMRPRHWKGMSDIAGFDLTPDAGTTLRKMLKLNLEASMEQFEGISAAATKVITGYMIFVRMVSSPGLGWLCHLFSLNTVFLHLWKFV